ncbi:MAG: 3-phosphoshikimate 1-carboxyvinyltransferase [Rhodospirillales bacterium]
MTALRSSQATSLKGTVAVPGDKSISHRAILLGASAIGETTVTGLLEGEDVLATAAAVEAMGAIVTRPATPGGEWCIAGRGVGGLSEPATVLDMGNSGTAARLMMGLLAAHPMRAQMTGDASLNGRPMQRVMTPLEKMGARFEARDGGRMPLCVIGSDELIPIEYELPVASAQVKSAILLAGLNTAGITTVIEPEPTRDHSEHMLRHFGAEVAVEEQSGGGRRISITGQPELTAQNIVVPGDISSAAFPLVAAAVVPGSDVTLANVGINPLRTGILRCLEDMGAGFTYANQREQAGEPVADIRIVAGPLKGIDVPPERAPAMIDEYPVLAVCAAFAGGTTRMTGIGELRVKESDRLAAVARGLSDAGVTVREGDDWLEVDGTGNAPKGGMEVAVSLDHRIAMAFLVMGMASRETVSIDDGSPINTSFPGFAELMNGLGGDIGPAREAA